MKRSAPAPACMLVLLCTGCSTVAEQPYPAGWPSLSPRGADCAEIGGRYKDAAIGADGESVPATRSLSYLLTGKEFPRARSVSITPPGEEMVIAVVDASQEAAIYRYKRDAAFVCEAGVLTLSRSHGALDPMAMYGEAVTTAFFQGR